MRENTFEKNTFILEFKKIVVNSQQSINKRENEKK